MLSETAHGSGELLSAALQRVAELEQHVDEDARNIESLERALARSRRIRAAVSIVMAASRTTEQAAFAVLRNASQHTNRKLRDIADDVVATGEVPTWDRPGRC